MDKTTVNLDLRVLRNKKGWNQEAAAKAAGISRSHYAMIESGKSRPGVDTAQKLAHCLDFDWQIFFPTNNVTPRTI